jgi:formylglycine-generating enzyme required for sulfatase activity
MTSILFCLFRTFAQDSAYSPEGAQIRGPGCAGIPQWNATRAPASCSREEVQDWLRDIDHWRDERRIRAGYEGSEYNRPELLWTQSSFVQPQMMVHDRFFYDPSARQYTVGHYLEDVTERYGGIDSVLIWPTYPNIGIDSRSQYDLFADLPMGTEGVKRVVQEFHRRGIRVLFPVMLWDQGTHFSGLPDAEAISRELAAVGADGTNGDTLEGMPRSFRTTSDKIGHPLALEPELALASDEMLAYNNLTWGYWHYDFIPSVSRYKWLEPRHMVHLSNRWAHSHLDDLQEAFFNGVGFESWENVWGIWNQITARDAETLRRIATIERAYASLLISSEWEPHTFTEQFGVFASKWPGKEQTLWTIVNRNHYAISGRQLLIPYNDRARYFDLWRGVELMPKRQGDETVLEFDLEADGFGAVLQTSNADQVLIRSLEAMQLLSRRPLNSFSRDWRSVQQHMVSIAPTKTAAAAPANMVEVPSADFVFRVNGVEIEGMNDDGVDFQYPWETSARRYHQHEIHINAFWIDKYPVSNADFKRFLDATQYHPADDHNFLEDWKDGRYPAGWENRPVTWVSIEDARAYARWAGKRLPHEWEWQYAAQGNDGRTYPWGNNWSASAVPATDGARDATPPSDVGAHPAGASPFGVLDMVGNVWQWTDEYQDEHTRAAVLRGGSHYHPQGSRWYFPQAYKLSQHGKYLLMAPSIDRSGTIGFRCVVDAR